MISIILLLSAKSLKELRGGGGDISQTDIPKFMPMGQVTMVHSPFQRHMLPDPDHHIPRRGHIDHGGFARIRRRNP